MVYPDSTIIEGGSFSGTDETPFTFGDGCIFTNCSFTNPCYFGEGCIFIGCTLVDAYTYYNTMPYTIGEGAVFVEGTTVNYSQIQNGSVWDTVRQVGYRPNTIMGTVADVPETKKSDGAEHKVTGVCTECGTLTVVNNGVDYSGPYSNGKDEKKGGPDVKSSGTCPNPCD